MMYPIIGLIVALIAMPLCTWGYTVVEPHYWYDTESLVVGIVCGAICGAIWPVAAAAALVYGVAKLINIVVVQYLTYRDNKEPKAW